jgi:hypothetical protein
LSIISGAATYLRTVRSAFGRIVVPGRSADTPDGSPAEGHPESPKEGFRPDVEGLRAVAVGVVLLYHAGVPFTPGGYQRADERTRTVDLESPATSLLALILARTGASGNQAYPWGYRHF